MGIRQTPMLSMLKAHAARRDKNLPTLHFIHSTQNANSHGFHQEVDDVITKYDEFHSHYIHTQANKSEKKGVDYHSTERLNLSQLQQVLDGMKCWFSGRLLSAIPQGCVYYICGPEAFQKSVEDILHQLEIPAEQIHKEQFHPAEDDQSVELTSAQVTFSASKQTTTWQADDNFSLLELAEEQDLTPAFGCRSGTCGLCSTKLKQGEVYYTRKPSITVADNEVLLCCAKPVGDIELAM